MLRLLHELAPRHAQAFGHLLQALDFHLSSVQEVALVGDDLEPLEASAWSAFLLPAPGARRRRRRWRAAAPGPPRGRPPCGVRVRALLCKAPVTEPEELERLLVLAIFALAAPSAHERLCA